MVRASLIVAGVLAFAGAAQAQTSTDCIRTAMGMQCNTSPSGDAQFVTGVSALANALAARRQHKSAATQFVAAIQRGDCDTARDLARRYGNADDMAAVAQCVAPTVAAEATAKENERIWMTTITAAVADGRCDEAKANALAGGRLDVADQVVRVCTPKRAP